MRGAALILGYCIGAAAGANEVLPAPVERVMTAHGIPAEGVSIVVQALDAEDALLRHLAQVPRNPASTIKLLTTWVALEKLGPTYSWPTEIYFFGDWTGTELHGDLALKGYGDPYLVTEEFWKMLGALRRTGLEEIHGDLVIDDSYFGAPAEDPGAFDGQPYRTYNVTPSALLVNFKAVRFQFLADPASRAVVITADPWPANLVMRNELELVGGACRGYQAGISFDLREPSSGRTAVFSGTFPEACAPYTLSRTVLQHDTFAYGVFDTLWRQLGGRFHGRMHKGRISEDAEPALTWRSRPLAEVIRSINKFSNNVMTRQLLYTLGAEVLGPPGTRAGGIEVIRAHLAERGLDPGSLVIDNGAGLSRETRISAALLAATLRLAARSPHGPEFLASLSLGGLDGTTRGRFNGGAEAGRMHVKTGRLDDVTALAGYVHAASGATYVVSAMVNAPDVHRGPGEELLDVLMRWIHAQP